MEWRVMNCFCGTNERRLVLCPAGTIIRDLHHREYRHAASWIWTYAELKFRLNWMKLCNRENRYTTAPQECHLLFCKIFFWSYLNRIFPKICYGVSRRLFLIYFAYFFRYWECKQKQLLRKDPENLSLKNPKNLLWRS